MADTSNTYYINWIATLCSIKMKSHIFSVCRKHKMNHQLFLSSLTIHNLDPEDIQSSKGINQEGPVATAVDEEAAQHVKHENTNIKYRHMQMILNE